MDNIRKLFPRGPCSVVYGRASYNETADLISAYFGLGIRASREINQHQGKEHVHPLQNTDQHEQATATSCVEPSSENKTSAATQT